MTNQKIYVIYSVDWDIFKIEGVTYNPESAKLIEEMTDGTIEEFDIQSPEEIKKKYDDWKAKQTSAEEWVECHLDKIKIEPYAPYCTQLWHEVKK